MRRGKGTTDYSAAMSSLLLPTRPLLMMFAGWANRHRATTVAEKEESSVV